jgi:hypothetical protein
MRREIHLERAEQRRCLDACADEHAIASHDGAVGQRRRAVVVDRYDLATVDRDPLRQSGQRAADAEASAEWIENSALPRRSRKGDSGRDIGPIKPGEQSTGARHRRRDVLAGADGDEALRTKQPSGAECRLPALPAGAGPHREPA